MPPVCPTFNYKWVLVQVSPHPPPLPASLGTPKTGEREGSAVLEKEKKVRDLSPKRLRNGEGAKYFCAATFFACFPNEIPVQLCGTKLSFTFEML